MRLHEGGGKQCGDWIIIDVTQLWLSGGCVCYRHLSQTPESLSDNPVSPRESAVPPWFLSSHMSEFERISPEANLCCVEASLLKK